MIHVNDELIAPFMGLPSYAHPAATAYDKSWDLLMPVIEKIGNFQSRPDRITRIEITSCGVRIDVLGERIFYNSSVEGSMLTATYKAAVHAIKIITAQASPGNRESHGAGA